MKTKTSFSAPLFTMIIYALIIASRFIQNKIVSSGGNVLLSIIILQIIIFILPAIIFSRIKGVGYSGKLNIHLIAPSKIGSIIVSAIVLICGSILIRLAEIYIFKTNVFHFTMFDSYLRYAESSDFLINAMTFAIMPAITEEFVFRAVVLTEYNESGYGAVTATLISSLLSSMMFFSLELLPIFFFSGIVFCILTYVTGSSLSALFAHIIFNIYGVFGEKYVLNAVKNPSNKIICIFTFTLFFLVFLIILFGEFEHILKKAGQTGQPTPSYKLKKSSDGTTPDIAATEADEDGEGDGKVLTDRSKQIMEAFLSPTLLLCVLIFLIAIFEL